MSVVERKPPERHRGVRNITIGATVDRDRYDALEEMSRGLGVTRSTAICRLIDLHAGAVLEAVMAEPTIPFARERARARKLTGELVDDVASLVREGMTKADAYRRCGVVEATAKRWEKRGREDRDADKGGLHADLVAALEQARAEFNHELIQEARRKGDYKTLLKMLDPEQFAPVARSTVDVSVRFQPLVDWERMPMEKARLLAQLLQEYSPGLDDPAVTRTARPAIEAVPADVLELVDDGEWTEAEAPALEAPALDEKPEH
jgi:hypothetical protein